MVRLLYGGRNSLIIGIGAALITTLLGDLRRRCSRATSAAGPTASISRFMDIIWAFPVILLGIALGTALALGGLQARAARRSPATASLIPILVIAVVYIPYLARPIRGEVLALREKEFVEAARAQGHGLAADHVRRDPAQHRLDDDRLLPAAGRQRDPARGGALVPRRRRAAARALLGDDDRRGRRADRHRPAPGDRARGDAGAHGALAEHLRRRRPRRARPAGEGQDRPAEAWMARFIVRRLVSMVVRAVRGLGAHLLHLQRDPERRPGGADGGQAADRDPDRGDPRGVGLQRAALRPVR